MLNALRAPEVVTGHGLRLTAEGPPRPERGLAGVSTAVALVERFEPEEGGAAPAIAVSTSLESAHIVEGAIQGELTFSDRWHLCVFLGGSKQIGEGKRLGSSDRWVQYIFQRASTTNLCKDAHCRVKLLLFTHGLLVIPHAWHGRLGTTWLLHRMAT